MPPMVTTKSDPASSRVAFFSMTRCLSKSAMVLLLFCRLQGRLPAHCAADRLFFALVAEDGHGDVVGHEHCPQKVEPPAQSTRQVVREHRCHGLREGVAQEALFVVLASHQA